MTKKFSTNRIHTISNGRVKTTTSTRITINTLTYNKTRQDKTRQGILGLCDDRMVSVYITPYLS